MFAQSPQAIKYQAIARDNAGNILVGQNVSFRISILGEAIGGDAVYVEIHDTVTNQFGLVSLEIGKGSTVLGDFAAINWHEGVFFLQTEIDPAGGSNYQLMGTTQLLSVPYSLYSELTGGMILTNENGVSYTVGVDTLGNITTSPVTGWTVCGDSLTDIRDWQKYATVQIGSFCWLGRNLNIGMRIDGVNDQADNGVMEKYCYDDLESNCDTFGGLYQWDELMKYTTLESTQGICPDDWHIPTDHEWKVLEGIVDSLYKIGDPEWNKTGFRGFNGGYHIKSTYGWFSNGNGDNLFGFIALAGGCRHYNPASFVNMSEWEYFWSSNEINTSLAWNRELTWDNNGISRHTPNDKSYGYAVRCIKDYTNQPPDQPSNPIPGNGSTNIGIDTVLSWSCTDPDGNALFYNIHFDTDPDPQIVAAGLDVPLFSPGNLNYFTTYYWKIVAFDSFGDSAVSNVWSFMTGVNPVFTCGNVFIDSRDGQTYATEQIGSQCWMAGNLNIGTMLGGGFNQINNSSIEKYCFDNSTTNCDEYGGLYQWNEMMQYSTTPGIKGICPDDWHLPTDSEWCTLEHYVDPTITCVSGYMGVDGGGKLKEEGTAHWVSPNTGGTNSVGFTALPGGARAYMGFFWDQGYFGYYWTSSNYNSSDAWGHILTYNRADIQHVNLDKDNGMSVRCVKN